MADVVYEMLAKISLDDSELKTGLTNAGQEINNSNIPEAAEGVSKRTATAVYAGVYGAVAGVAGLTKLAVSAGNKLRSIAVDSAQYADELLTNSIVTGLSTDQLQEYGYMAELVDVSVDTITGSMTKLTRAMSQARGGSEKQAEAFEKLGVNVTNADGSLRDTNDVFYDAIEALGQIENETERDALAMEIFGRSAKDLNPLIAAGRYGIQKFAQEAHDMGYVLDEETLKSLGALDDSMQRLSNFRLSIRNRLGIAMAPAMERVVTKLLEVGNKIDWASIGEKLGNVIENFVEKLLGFLEKVDFDKLIDGAMTLFDALISGISWVLEHADEIVKLIRDIGIGFVVGKGAKGAASVFDFASGLFGGGAKTATATAEAAAAGPKVGAALGTAAGGSFWSTVLAASPLAAIAGGVVIGGVQGANYFNEKWARYSVDNDATVEEIEAQIADLEARIAQRKQEVADATLYGTYDTAAQADLEILEAALADAKTKLDEARATQTTDAAAWGSDMMASLASGITTGATMFVGPAVTGVASLISSMLHHSEPETGPLSDDSTWMPDMMRGFADDIRRGAPEIRSAVADAFDFRENVGFGINSGRGNMNVTINVNGARYSDDESLAERISFELRQLFAREDAAYA